MNASSCTPNLKQHVTRTRGRLVEARPIMRARPSEQPSRASAVGIARTDRPSRLARESLRVMLEVHEQRPGYAELVKTLEALVDESSDPKYYRHAVSKLDDGQRERIRTLATQLVSAGATDAFGWAYSEVCEGIAQTARFLVLRDLCACARDVDGVLDGCETDDARGVFDALLEAGTDRHHLERLVLAVAKSTVWHCVTTLDEGGFGAANAVGWALAETDAEGTLTGRLVHGLHESAQDEEFLGEPA